jgi:glycosyltransferase involved in cell wall biosynthesis
MEKQNPEVSIVMPCLNEEKTIGICIKKAKQAIRELKLDAEVIVSDNDSSDKSVEIAESLGARVVHQSLRGYGNAYKKGFAQAKGKYILMGDSDNTYDFTDISRFIEPLKKDYDMVMGTRLKGKIMPGAMPWLHQYIGNPFLTGLIRLLFKSHISDAHCGMRSFTKGAYEKMHLKTAGMEFASEIVINAIKARLRIKEIPITLYANRERIPHLNSLNDGWRHIKFILSSFLYEIFRKKK